VQELQERPGWPAPLEAPGWLVGWQGLVLPVELVLPAPLVLMAASGEALLVALAAVSAGRVALVEVVVLVGSVVLAVDLVAAVVFPGREGLRGLAVPEGPAEQGARAAPAACSA
jgi:hypothetical protein